LYVAYYMYILRQDVPVRYQIYLLMFLFPAKFIHEYVFHILKFKPWELIKKLFGNAKI
jgi:hypothetical protein